VAKRGNMTDDELRCQVAAELSWDPQLDNEAIEVSADSGTVTLRGTVASLRQKQAGGKATHRTRPRGYPGRQRTAGADPGQRPAGR
jgi:osmotically-inducible protein OsmY